MIGPRRHVGRVVPTPPFTRPKVSAFSAPERAPFSAKSPKTGRHYFSDQARREPARALPKVPPGSSRPTEIRTMPAVIPC